MNLIPRLTSTGNMIFILDDLFTPHEHLLFLRNVQNFQWKFITPGTHVPEHKRDTCLARMFEDPAGEQVGITRAPAFDTILELIGPRREATRCWVNLVHVGAESYYHPDGFDDTDLTFLYYMNSDWGLNWGGETLLCDANGEPELVVRYKPNRGVMFPSKLLHRIASPSRHSAPWRYSFVMQFSALKEVSDAP